jgi:hypothetical protein
MQSFNLCLSHIWSVIYVFRAQKKVSGTGKEFHSLSENEAPDMNVHSLAGRAMEMKECCQYSTGHPRMASAHLGGTRNQPAWTQENNVQLAWNSNASQRAQAQIPIILWAFLHLFSLYPQQQGPVLKILRSVACQQRSSLRHRGASAHTG